jgi:hypothetical protein
VIGRALAHLTQRVIEIEPGAAIERGKKDRTFGRPMLGGFRTISRGPALPLLHDRCARI